MNIKDRFNNLKSYKPFIKFIYPCVQFNFEKSWWDYLSISFFFPFYDVGKFRDDMDVEQNKIYSLNAPSTISFVKSGVHFGFKVQLFGFGIGLLRQNGY